jgi:hypothetical protein
MSYSGTCLCGDIAYRCEAAAVTTAICHCRDCQKQSGSAFSVNLLVPAAALQVSGASLRSVFTEGASGASVRRHFCGNCGTPVYTEMAALPALVALKAGTLTDTAAIQPKVQLWCASAQPWVTLDADLPSFAHAASV